MDLQRFNLEVIGRQLQRSHHVLIWKKRHDRPYILFLFGLFLLFTPCVGYSNPPEGVESFGLLNDGRVSSALSTLITHTSPAWRSNYQSFEAIGSLPLGDDLLTFGGQTTVSDKFSDRSAYFGRFDWTLGLKNSLSIKWLHDDWKYISTSRDTFGVEFNQYIPFSKQSGVYFSIGGYYRFLKHRWNSPWWSPFNFNTDDKEGFLTGIIGWKNPLGSSSFFTVDANIRDTWGYYNLDSIGGDINIYWGKPGFYWKLNTALRSSATFVGTIYPAYFQIGLGFIVH